MASKTRNKVDYAALNKPYLGLTMEVANVQKHRNYETNKGFIITLNVINERAQIKRFSFDKLQLRSKATLDPQGNLVGLSDAAAQKRLAKEDNAFNNAMTSIASLVKDTIHNPSS